jgi:hypothetical protein
MTLKEMTLKEMNEYYCKIKDKKMNRLCILSKLMRIIPLVWFIVSAILTVVGLIIIENGMMHTRIANILGYIFILMSVVMMLFVLLKKFFEDYIETGIPNYISNQALHELTIGLPDKAWFEVWEHEKLEETKNGNK